MAAVRRFWSRAWRRTWRIGGLASIVLGAALAGWIIHLGSPRIAHLERARAPIASISRTSQPLGEAVELTATDGFVVRAGVARDLTHDRPRAVIVVVGGLRTGRDTVRIVGDPGAIAVVAIDYPYDGPDRIRGVWQAVRHVPGIRQALLDTPRAVSQTVDWILAEPWADPAHVELVGVSLGVPFAAASGALDARFVRVWLIQGAADNRLWIERNLERKIGWAPVRSGAAWLVHRLAHGATFDTGAWAGRIAPRPVVVVGAEQDQSLTREMVEAVYAASGDPRELHWVPGRHVNPRRPESVQPLLELVRSRL